jgi:hypothetical protein
MKKTLYLTLLAVISLATQAQVTDQLYFTQVSGSSSYFVSLDLQTGQTTTLSNISNMTVWQGTTTFDRINRRYFGKGGQITYIVDAATGTLLDTLLKNVNTIEYDKTCSCLFGTRFYNNTNQLYSIDLFSKSLSGIGTILGNSYSFGESFYDDVHGRYFNINGQSIDVFDTTANQIDAIPMSTVLTCIEYDPTGDQLVGIYFKNNTVVVAVIDVNTHQYQDITMVNTTSSLLSGESTFDSANQRYFFKTLTDVYMVDIPNIAVFNFPLNQSYVGIEYYSPPPPPPPTNTTGISNYNGNPGIKVCSDSFDTRFTFRNLEPNSQVNVYNTNGQVVLNRITNEEALQIDLSFAPAGIYVYSVNTTKGVSRGKLLVR